MTATLSGDFEAAFSNKWDMQHTGRFGSDNGDSDGSGRSLFAMGDSLRNGGQGFGFKMIFSQKRAIFYAFLLLAGHFCFFSSLFFLLFEM